MSGTSLDGLDLALVEFILEDGIWSFELVDSETISYGSQLKERLEKSIVLAAGELSSLDREFGKFIGSQASHFANGRHVDFISSHGHTVFHQPEKNITLQIGSGKEILRATGIPVIFDFRSKDVRLGGQGAPLVPIGDKLLFGNYDVCLNLGGIANCSFEKDNQRVAYDIAPFNMVFNRLAEVLGKPFDDGGKIARDGKPISNLLEALNDIPYYKNELPKSLGLEDYQKFWKPYFQNTDFEVKDLMHTYAIHVAKVIGENLNQHFNESANLLITGGGSYNEFFIEKLNNVFQGKIVIPSTEIIDYKEAIIFGFMGVLRYQDRTNCLASVTGASQDSSAGIMLGF